MIIIGLDVHPKSTTKYCIQEKESGRQLKIGECETNYEGFKLEIGPWIKRYPGAEVGMEAGSKTYHVTTIINELGGKPRVFSAEEVSAKSRSKKKKTDYRDAMDLCNNFRTESLVKEVKLPQKELKDLRTLMKGRDLYVNQRSQIINQTRSYMKEYGIKDDIKDFNTKDSWERLLGKDIPEFLKEIFEIHSEQYRSLSENIKRIEEKMKEYEKESPEFEILKTIPGVGKILSAALKAYIFDINRFKSAKHLTSYFGLVPSCYDSGERVCHGRITKEGNKFVRKLLIEAAQHYCNPHSPLYPFYARLVGRKGWKKARVALAAKLCRMIYAILKKGEPFNINQLGVLKGPVEIPKKYYYILNREKAAVQSV